jgi:hypothetical protein
MAHSNLEEALVARIHRALAKELKRLRRTPRTKGNGHATGRALPHQATVMSKTAVGRNAAKTLTQPIAGRP